MRKPLTAFTDFTGRAALMTAFAAVIAATAGGVFGSRALLVLAAAAGVQTLCLWLMFTGRAVVEYIRHRRRTLPDVLAQRLAALPGPDDDLTAVMDAVHYPVRWTDDELRDLAAWDRECADFGRDGAR